MPYRSFAKALTLLYDSSTMKIRTTTLTSALSWKRYSALLYWPWELILLLAVSGWLYRQTMPPGISSWLIEGWDSAMFQVTGSTWGLAHSPGYPLYTLLANLFVRLLGLLPGVSTTSVVWRVSFWSTTTSLLTLIFLYLIARRVGRNRAGALLACALLALSFIFWRAAIMAEVYSLNALIFVLSYWLAITWDEDRRDRWLIALGLVLGAGLVHHRTAFILPPTMALWLLLKRPNKAINGLPDLTPTDTPWRQLLRRWLILGGAALLPLLTYLYLPWVAHYRIGQSWIYADASDWNTFWFIVVAREWWGLVQIPATLPGWGAALQTLFWQQAEQLTLVGLSLGLAGLLLARRYLWLFGPPFVALTFFGATYQVADLDSMLIPLSLTLCLCLGILIGSLIRRLVTWLVKVIRVRDEAFRGKWLSPAVRWLISLGLLIGLYFPLAMRAEKNYHAVDLSGDWQAVDLVEEVVAIARAGTPLTIIGQDNSVLPAFIYTKAVLGQPVEPLSTTGLARLPEATSIAMLKHRFSQGNRLLVDLETIQLRFIPWLNQAINSGQVLLAPTGHPYLWELLPRPIKEMPFPNEPWLAMTSGQFLDGRVSIIAYHQQIVAKRTGCFLRLTLLWRAETDLTDDYYISVQPLGGETVLEKNDHLALIRGYLPTSQVSAGEVIRDEIDLLIRQPAALPGVSLVVNLYQVQGDQYPTFGQVTLPITVEAQQCNRPLL
jgi:hypothetical protein